MCVLGRTRAVRVGATCPVYSWAKESGRLKRPDTTNDVRLAWLGLGFGLGLGLGFGLGLGLG